MFATAVSRKPLWAFWWHVNSQELAFHDSQSFVQRIPQRYYNLDSTSSEADLFWGIVACDQLSVFTCLIYASWFFIMQLSFIVWWVVSYRASGDWSLIITSTITTVSVMFAWYYIQA
jgi:hypothetical protein